MLFLSHAPLLLSGPWSWMTLSEKPSLNIQCRIELSPFCFIFLSTYPPPCVIYCVLICNHQLLLLPLKTKVPWEQGVIWFIPGSPLPIGARHTGNTQDIFIHWMNFEWKLKSKFLPLKWFPLKLFFISVLKHISNETMVSGFINSMSQVTLIKKKKKKGKLTGKAAAQISCRTSKPFKPESQKHKGRLRLTRETSQDVMIALDL